VNGALSSGITLCAFALAVTAAKDKQVHMAHIAVLLKIWRSIVNFPSSSQYSTVACVRKVVVKQPGLAGRQSSERKRDHLRTLPAQSPVPMAFVAIT
jgi:hypothetical protein